jgi:NADH:ubiquinone oxidoreductase subunit K
MAAVPMEYGLILAGILFALGLAGVLVRSTPTPPTR